MISYRLTSFILGLLIGGGIILLVRKDLLHTRYAVMWFVFGVSAVLLGMFPQVSDWVAAYLGVHYAPILFVIVALGAILIKILTMDIDRSKQEQHIRRLNEKIAVLESSISEFTREKSQKP